MIARCPIDKSHKTFYTTATVSEDWLVEENGDFISTTGSVEVINYPDPENIWECGKCGENAIVTS